MAIIWLDTVDSTNNEALGKADILDNLSVIAAETQTAGKGQRGNRWFSERGCNLTFSIVLKDETLALLDASDQFLITEAVTLALTDYLAGKGIPAKVKWPNDIYVRDRKICGVLIENTLYGNRLRRSVVGVGLNVNQRVFPKDLPNPTSMSLESGKHYDTKDELKEFMVLFRQYADCITDIRAREGMRSRYLERMYRKDEPHLYHDVIQDSNFTGIIRGINATGELVVQMPDGCERAFGFKEISYII